MPVLQAKLQVGPPNDRFEQEADRVADQVMRMAEPQRPSPIDLDGQASPDGVQRMCAECEEEVRRQTVEDEEEELQMKRAPGATAELGRGIQAQISALRGGGRPLSAAERAFFEPRFGHDFGQVRIHTEPQAAKSARALNARAYTIGRHIVVGSHQLAPGTQVGLRLLAHELTHVVQQEGGGAPAVQRQQIQPTCEGTAYDPERQCCCDYGVIPGPCTASSESSGYPTMRDNEYDGCSVPEWLTDPAFKDNPGLAADTWFSDPSIHGTRFQLFEPKLPCDVHDKCYQTCSADPEGHWRACDQQLFADAEAVCERHRMAHGEDYNYSLCIDAVLKARTLLPRGSWGSFIERQRQYCAGCPPPPVREDVPIFFDSGSAELDPAAQTILRGFVERHRALLASGAFGLDLIGNASRLGSEADNLDLSKRRIAAVRAGIERLLGAPLSRVGEYPLGEKEAEEEVRPGEDDSRENRRVDIQIAGGTP